MRNILGTTAVLILAGCLDGTAAQAETAGSINELNRVALAGNTPVEALQAAQDLGRVSDRLPFEHMLLVLKRSAEREGAFQRYVDGLTDRRSPNYHHWLTADEIGAIYGPGQRDIARVTGWLYRHGFAVNRVYPSRMAIDFSGNAGNIREAFQTDIHALEVGGEHHIANISDPKIPAALAPVVAGVASLHDFHGHRASHGGPGWTVDGCKVQNDLSPNCYWVTPPDLATIYNIGPVFKAGTTGKGQTIAVAEDSDIYTTDDWTRFRSLFGLAGYTSGSIAQTHPGGCPDPGANPDDFETTLDAEYASASAPDAAVVVASCLTSQNTWGVTTAVENIVNSSSPPSILSVSYIWCEHLAGAANNKIYYDAYEQAAAEGTSVFVSSGDEGAATCDYGASKASQGIAVNGLASTPYNVAVGGTDFSDTYHKENATYWNSTSDKYYGSAKSYVPEIPWNSSCASQLIADYVTGSKLTYGSGGFCNVSAGAPYITTLAGSGGPSTCALNKKGGGGCKGYAKPAWQSVYGNAADRVRDVPDVALFSAGPVWGHGYIICYSDPNNDFNTPCSRFPSAYIYGYGTSFASPIMAGIQALVNQATASLQGNPDPALYRIADREYGSHGNSTCNASLGNKIGSKCVFLDVRNGDMDVPCTPGTKSCYAPSGNTGVLSKVSSRYLPAYISRSGWDFASGLGSVNAANLVTVWPR